MSDVQWVGVAFIAAGVLLWWLAARVVRDHEPANPRAQARRPRSAGVWSDTRRTFSLWRGRSMAVLFVGFGVLLVTGLFGG